MAGLTGRMSTVVKAKVSKLLDRAEDPADLEGPRWRPLRQANPGYTVRHPLGL